MYIILWNCDIKWLHDLKNIFLSAERLVISHEQLGPVWWMFSCKLVNTFFMWKTKAPLSQLEDQLLLCVAFTIIFGELKCSQEGGKDEMYSSTADYAGCFNNMTPECVDWNKWNKSKVRNSTTLSEWNWKLITFQAATMLEVVENNGFFRKLSTLLYVVCFILTYM